MNAPGIILAVMISCSVNVMILEVQIREDSGSSNLITFSQFLFNSIVSFAVAMDFGRKKNVIPVKRYLVLTTMFFVQSWANNLALSYDISMPVHMIVKSGSLVASMTLGVIFLRRRYSLTKWVSIILVTLGIFLCTWATAQEKMASHKASHSAQHSKDHHAGLIRWLTGVGLVVSSVFISAGMGVYQEKLFAQFGRHAQEGIFFSHALPLPGFILLWSDIVNHASTFSHSAPFSLDTFGLRDFHLPIPRLWMLLAANLVTQYMCSSSVFSLVSISDALTVTLVITIRKFLSLFISVLWFKNPFTTLHWIGTVCVIVGTLLYIDIPAMRRQAQAKLKKT